MDDRAARAIAEGLRAGDSSAWRELYDSFAVPTWRLVARWLGANSADVADVVQETFLAAARSAQNFDPDKGSLWWWLCGIARNQAALHGRRTARRRQVIGEIESLDDPEFAAPFEGDPCAMLLVAEQAEIVRAVLLELPDEYALLLSAKYFDDVSVEELAAATRSSEVAVRSKLARARGAFRVAFGRQMKAAACSV